MQADVSITVLALQQACSLLICAATQYRLRDYSLDIYKLLQSEAYLLACHSNHQLLYSIMVCILVWHIHTHGGHNSLSVAHLHPACLSTTKLL